jgi:hypothetical protein
VAKNIKKNNLPDIAGALNFITGNLIRVVK